MRFTACLLAAFFGVFVFNSLRADSVLFIGNSFTFAAQVPALKNNGGVPKLFAAIARAKGKIVETRMIAAPGVNWGYHLAHPTAAQMLALGPWTWVVLQDNSTEPTRIGDIPEFMRDGETFSDRIAAASPHTGIILYETWARPAGRYYWPIFNRGFSGPAEMMLDLHTSYARLAADLARRDPQREVRVAPVGTAFARASAETTVNVNAADGHHASADGYYLAALIIYETIYHASAVGAPTSFFDGHYVIREADAAKLQAIADGVAGGQLKTATR